MSIGDASRDRGPECKGHMYYAWLTEKELVDAFWAWYTAEEHREYRKGIEADQNKKSAWKEVLKTAMLRRGRPVLDIKPTVGDRRPHAKSYNNVAFL
jgi:hypothetical protein